MKSLAGSVLDRDHLVPEQAAAVFSLSQGAVIESNRRFRDLFGTPETIADLEAPDLHRVLRTWDGTEPRLIRRMTLDGIEGRGRLLPVSASFPIQAILQFAPRVDEGRLKDLLEDRLQQIGNFERMRALGETAAVIVHEIRTPLSSIRLGIESVRSSRALPAGLCPRLDVALEQLGRLDKILGSIRNFARPRRLEPRPMDLRKTFTEALAAVEAALLAAPRTTVAVDVRPDPLWITADPGGIAEVIQNLVLNAVEARPEGGKISLTATTSGIRTGWVEIQVVDQGPGIPPFQMHRVFQPFFTTKRTGTGLGLAIVKNLVELHGGFVSLQSSKGRGTTVTIELPAGGPAA
jgi:signal transduction histidine kinase